VTFQEKALDTLLATKVNEIIQQNHVGWKGHDLSKIEGDDVHLMYTSCETNKTTKSYYYCYFSCAKTIPQLELLFRSLVSFVECRPVIVGMVLIVLT